MTNDEAIYTLKNTAFLGWSEQAEKVSEAVQMAVEALKRETSGDAIDRQAAIRWVKTECNPYGKPTLDFESGKRVMEHLKTMPSVQPEPQWIPVSERLPETEEFVLASLTGKYRNTTFEHACEIADYADGEWCVYAYPHMSAEKCEELIEAWMPLPKPFEGGTE